jgi:hypothetical protein
MDARSFLIRLYFIVISAIALIMIAIGSVGIIDTGLKTYVFPAADAPRYLEDCSNDLLRVPVQDSERSIAEGDKLADCEKRRAIQFENYASEKAADAVQNLAFILVFLPIFILHFRMVYRDWKAEHPGGSKPKK